MSYCPYCGTANEDSYLVCRHCHKRNPLVSGNAEPPGAEPPDRGLSDPDAATDDHDSDLVNSDGVPGSFGIAAAADRTLDLNKLKKNSRFTEHFVIQRKLGAGGMGVVYAVYDEVMEEAVALKIIHPRFAASESARKRFINEIKIARKIVHPNVIRVHDGKIHRDALYFTMELLEGVTLRAFLAQHIEQRKPIPLKTVLRLMEQLCAGLAAAHRLTIHRDLKPENVFICQDDSVKILDFGLARALNAHGPTMEGQRLGTAYYIAPEQFDGALDQLDARADVFSLGVILYELLTLMTPMGWLRPPSTLRQDVTSALDAVVIRCMEREPGQRFPSVQEAYAAFREAVEGKPRPVAATPEPPVKPQPAPQKSKPQAAPTQTLADKLTTKCGLELKLIQPGTFQMGSPKDDPDREDDEILINPVTISKPFYLGVTFVTRGQFAAFVKATGYKTTAEVEGFAWTHEKHAKAENAEWKSHSSRSWLNPEFKQDDAHPVVCVSWYDAVAFCNWLSEQAKLPLCYQGEGDAVQCDFAATGFRLPTEAEWEYACRAGTTTRFSFGDDLSSEHANFGNTIGQTTPVKRYPPNRWDLYDMHGNVWEWCWDWYDRNYCQSLIQNKPTVDPLGPSTSDFRVLRGGSWFNSAASGRSANRCKSRPLVRYSNYGFRVAAGARRTGV